MSTSRAASDRTATRLAAGVLWDPWYQGSPVLCLPVPHTGGALHVEHDGHSVQYEWGEGASRGEVQWAAFFGDCLHEVLPVTSGARVTMTYDLFAEPGWLIAIQTARLQCCACQQPEISSLC